MLLGMEGDVPDVHISLSLIYKEMGGGMMVLAGLCICPLLQIVWD